MLGWLKSIFERKSNNDGSFIRLGKGAKIGHLSASGNRVMTGADAYVLIEGGLDGTSIDVSDNKFRRSDKSEWADIPLNDRERT